MEFLVRTTTAIPHDVAPQRIADLREGERAMAMQLRAEGILLKLWRLPGRNATLGVYETRDASQLHDVLSSLPMFPFMTVEVEALATHPQERMLAEASAAVVSDINGVNR